MFVDEPVDNISHVLKITTFQPYLLNFKNYQEGSDLKKLVNTWS